MTFDIPGEDAEVSCLVVDLTAGGWKVERAGAGPATACEATQEGGALYFKGRPGKYTLTE